MPSNIPFKLLFHGTEKLPHSLIIIDLCRKDEPFNQHSNFISMNVYVLRVRLGATNGPLVQILLPTLQITILPHSPPFAVCIYSVCCFEWNCAVLDQSVNIQQSYAPFHNRDPLWYSIYLCRLRILTSQLKLDSYSFCCWGHRRYKTHTLHRYIHCSILAHLNEFL